MPSPSTAPPGAAAGAGFPAAIAIPARDEVGRLPHCLDALARQRHLAPADPAPLTVLVLANNCTDGTAALARSLAPRLPYRLVVQEAALPREVAHAGGARRAAMDAAAKLLGPAAASSGAILLSTDADGRPEPGWLAANLAALAAGADAVAGAIAPDPEEEALLPAALRRREALEAGYAAQLDEMASLVDPDPHDPWPRHDAHSGASIALTLAAYRRVGGLPAVPVGEDRALFTALTRRGMRVRHCPAARVIVSCRLDGRAAGGMADTLRRRLAEADAAPLDARLEPAGDALFRLRCRRALRCLHAGATPSGDPQRLVRTLGLAPTRLAAIAHLPDFWQAWEALQAQAPRLCTCRPVRIGDLGREIPRAGRILAALRGGLRARA